MKIVRLTEYTPEVAARVRELLIQLSRSGKDRGEIPREWFDTIINSPWHEMLLAVDDEAKGTSTPYPGGQILGIATLSVIMGPIVRRVAYLEDFVTDTTVRGKGVGSALWAATLEWASEKGCTELNFTSGHGREAAQEFYKHKGAEIYDTNFFRKNI